jgi:hypothetical protein
VIPAIPATHVYVDASQAAMLAHGSAVIGDISKRTDLGTSFILSALPSSTLANWITITDASSVTTVNGLSGAVTLTTSNIAEGSNLYYTTARTNTDAPNVTLSAGADTLLGLSAQQLTLDTQSANTLLLGPTTGAAAAPTFRSLVAADIPTGLLDGRYLHQEPGRRSTFLNAKANLAGGNSFAGQQLYTVSAPMILTVSGTPGYFVKFNDALDITKFSVDVTGRVDANYYAGPGNGLTNIPEGGVVNLTGGPGQPRPDGDDDLDHGAAHRGAGDAGRSARLARISVSGDVGRRA